MFYLKYHKGKKVDEIIEKKLYEHESKLAKVETILERVAVNQDKMAEAVTQISSSILKQELILEKLSSLETTSKGSFERVHYRIDKLDAGSRANDIKLDHLDAGITEVKQNIIILVEKDEEHDEKFKELEVFSLIKKYPVAAGLICLGLYSLTFEPVRNTVTTILGFF